MDQLCPYCPAWKIMCPPFNKVTERASAIVIKSKHSLQKIILVQFAMAISVRAGLLALYVLSALYVLPNVSATWTRVILLQIFRLAALILNWWGFVYKNCKCFFFVLFCADRRCLALKLKGANSVFSSNVAGHLTEKLKAEDNVCKFVHHSLNLKISLFRLFLLSVRRGGGAIKEAMFHLKTLAGQISGI